MIKVVWPTTNISLKAHVWRVLDLSGLTSSIRESSNFTRAGLIYLNNSLITKCTTIGLGVLFTLEIRFPNKTISKEIMLVPRTPGVTRQTGPFSVNYRG